MLNTEQITAAQKAHVETLLTLGSKAFEGVEKLTALNLQAARTTLNESHAATLALLSAGDPQSLLALHTQWLEPATDKLAAYARHVFDIVAATKAELERVIAEYTAGAQESFAAAFDGLAANVPGGAAGGFDLFKSALAAANNALDDLQKVARQVGDAAEANFAAVTSEAAKVAKVKAD